MQPLRWNCSSWQWFTAAALLTSISLSLTACRVGPNYRPPAMPMPPAYRGAGADAATSQSSIGAGDWWQVFQEPQLEALEKQTDAANTDIRIAVTRVDEAAASTGYARSYMFPTISGQPAAGRMREAQDRPNNGTTNGQAATYNDFQLPLVFDFEIDAWGRVRRTVEAARATQQATADDFRFVRLTAEASVAIDYYQLREKDQELRVLDSTIADLQNSLDLTTELFHHGLSGELQVAQAKTLLDQTRASEQTLSTGRAQSEHAIAVLIGRTAESFSIPAQTDAPPPPDIPIGLPSDLLKRRPDVLEAERNVAAASAEIGVAKAAYFPRLSLSGLSGFESTNAASLLRWQNSIASLGAGAVAPIFTAGRVHAGVQQATDAYEGSLARYEKTVLTSYTEVEDQLSALEFLTAQSRLQAVAVEDAMRSEQLANDRFKAGLVSYLDVVTAEQAVLFNQRTAAQIAGERMVATVVLIKALGGGWTRS
ncbi:efflux transporter outer membrane subunit [Edaphobacter sp. HDX4]|uniref:efflux transporter outer membrane subunit n=1 Tax=Edaphobacter sp. HDX4 TaxID=2794064 RepID=UPI002FE66816